MDPRIRRKKFNYKTQKLPNDNVNYPVTMYLFILLKKYVSQSRIGLYTF